MMSRSHFLKSLSAHSKNLLGRLSPKNTMSGFTSPPSMDQVWSLTQVYFVDFSKSRIDVKKCVFYRRTIKVCVSFCWRRPGTSAPCAAHLMVSLYLCSSGSNAQGESRAREARRVSSKSPSRVRDRDEGVAGTNKPEKWFPNEGTLPSR